MEVLPILGSSTAGSLCRGRQHHFHCL